LLPREDVKQRSPVDFNHGLVLVMRVLVLFSGTVATSTSISHATGGPGSKSVYYSPSR